MSSPLEFIQEAERAYIEDTLESDVETIQRERGAAQEENQRLRDELDAARSALDSERDETRQVASAMQSANAALARRLGGDWKEMALLLASAVVGLGIGYWIQRKLDKRVPWTALGGLALVGAGAAIRTRWSVRGALIVGGGMIASGSTLYVFCAPAAPASIPEGAGA